MKKTKPNRGNKANNNTFIYKFGKVQLVAALIYSLMFFIGSVIFLQTDLPKKYDFIISLSVFAISSLMVGFIAGIKQKQNGLISGILYSLPMNVIVILLSLIIGKFNVGVNLAITVITLIVFSAVGGILAVNKRRQ